MSEEKENTKTQSLQEQLEAIRQFAEMYNSDGIHTLQKAQMLVNRNWIKLLNEQRSLSENDAGSQFAAVYEALAAEKLRRTHIEGEIHIFEHHRSSPILFYFQKVGQHTNLMLHKDHQVHNLGNQVWLFAELINRTGDRKGIRLSSILAFDRSKDDSSFKVDLSFHFLETNRTTTIETTCYSTDNKNFKLTEIERQVGANGKYSSDTWIFHTRRTRNSDSYSALYLANNTTVISNFQGAPMEANFKSAATPSSPILPRFAAASDDRMDYYLVDGETLRTVSHLSSRNKLHFAKNEISPPIAIGYYENHDSIVIRTTKEIGLYFPNLPQKPLWRSFGENAFLPLPNRSITSGVTFTISCLLHFRPQPTGTYPPPPKKTAPAVKSNFGFWIEENEFVVSYTESHTLKRGELRFKFNKSLLPQIDSDWFQFSLVKSNEVLDLFIDGNLIASSDVPEQFYVVDNVNLSCPGFMMAELRIWNKIRTSEELIKYKRTWLPSSEFDGLTAYWHLFVNKDRRGLAFEHVNENGEIDMIQEPDLSGHGRHLIAQLNPVRQPGELNYHTYTVDRAPSPFPKFIPLYPIKASIQNFELDQSTGRIFWSDKNEENKTVMYTGSALGNSRATVFIEGEILSDIALVEQSTSMHNELILAHAQRRNLIESIFFGTIDLQNTAHEKTAEAHRKLDQTLTEQVEAREKILKNEGDKKAEYLAVHAQWQKVVDAMRQREQDERIKLRQERERALNTAQELTQDSIAEVHASRHPR